MRPSNGTTHWQSARPRPPFPAGAQRERASAAIFQAGSRGESGRFTPEEAEAVLQQAVEEDPLQELPEGFDASSTLLAANLPDTVSSMEVGAHFSWYAPVLRVTRLETKMLGNDASYLITFVDTESATSVLKKYLGHFGSGGYSRPVRLRALPEQETVS
ncbi:unnamed protein product [Effrenium voratum]|uniref:RRM domain-containing protein n=1 Tax=Effrenium voratum TaxID=2562239 RepID=A0AA36IIN2_9DINO|nr:unnamed protein product [Effrenium voratum]